MEPRATDHPSEDIEITPAMLKAGAIELSRCTADYFDSEDVAESVYAAMERTRRLSA